MEQPRENGGSLSLNWKICVVQSEVKNKRRNKIMQIDKMEIGCDKNIMQNLKKKNQYIRISWMLTNIIYTRMDMK